MTAKAPPTSEYLAAANEVISAANGIDYAYRQVGEGTPALVLLQHFRGNLDNWDPALVDALARDRRVVTFDNAGVGGSSGRSVSTLLRQFPSRFSQPAEPDGRLIQAAPGRAGGTGGLRTKRSGWAR
jgi:pimeloyl-ACP methyl ester carboxylesterase